LVCRNLRWHPLVKACDEALELRFAFRYAVVCGFVDEVN